MRKVLIIIVPAFCFFVACGPKHVPPPQQVLFPAKTETQLALEKVPSVAVAAFNLGVAQYQQGKYEEAANAFRDAADNGAVNPRFQADAIFKRAVCLDRTGHRGQALELVRTALSVNPNHVEALVFFSNLLTNAGDFDGAQRALNRAYELKPDDHRIRDGLANVLVEKGDLENAEELITARLAENPNEDSAKKTLARLLVRKADRAYASGDENTAMELASRASLMDQTDATAEFIIGRILLTKGMFDDAMEHYNEGLRRDPDLAHLQEASFLLAVKGKTQDWQESMGHARMAEFFQEKGNLNSAVKEYEQALSLRPKEKEWHYKIGKLQLQLGNAQKAAEHLHALLILAPAWPQTKELAAALPKEAKQVLEQKSPKLISITAGLGYNAETKQVFGQTSSFPSGASVYRAIALDDIMGMHSVRRVLLRPNRTVAYDESFKMTFLNDQYTLVSHDRCIQRGTWIQEIYIDGMLLGKMSFAIE